MKKIILAILCVVLVVSLFAACGRENVGDYTEKPSQNNTSMTTINKTTTNNPTTGAPTTNSTTGVLTPSTGGVTTQASTTTGANNG